MTIVFYVSGHGFGHASRVIEVINALAGLAPGTSLIVRTSTPKWLFDVTLGAPAAYHGAVCDVGVLQGDSLHLDIPRTAREAAAFYAGLDDRAGAEAAFLNGCGADLVVADIPPLAFAAADRAGIPSVAMANFTWDWIYGAYREDFPALDAVNAAIRRAHGLASAVIRLPMWGGFEGFRCPIVDVPFVARHSTRDPAEVRAWLDLRPGQRMALASFGGLGIAGLELEPLARLSGFTVVTTGHALSLRGNIPAGVRLLDDRAIYAAGFRYEDLVRAADVVVTKPGYGIIAECLANDTAMLYTSRGHFVEYDVMVEAMPHFLRCRFIGQEDLYGGHWQAHLDALVAQPPPPERPATDGAEVAARLILGSDPKPRVSG